MNKHPLHDVLRAYAEGWTVFERMYTGAGYAWGRCAAPPAGTDPSKYRIEPDEDGWLPWYGGNCPVAIGERVEVRLASGTLSGPNVGVNYRWNHLDDPSDIVRYRIAKRKMWQWIISAPNGRTYISAGFFESEDEVRKMYPRYTVIQRADWTEITVDASVNKG